MGNILSNKIKALRKMHYKNQAAFAEKLGLSTSAYSKIETGITVINHTRIKQIADLFQIPTAILLPEEDADIVRAKANYDELKITVDILQSEVMKLQSKLIEVYQENEVLKNKVETQYGS